MPSHTFRPPFPLLGLVVGVLASVGVALALPAPERDEPPVAVSGQLEIEGTVYRFAPTTCTITGSDFLAAGSGSIDGESFWVSASPDRVDLAVGPTSKLERPRPDQLWLLSVDDISWQVADRSITARLTMQDERSTKARRLVGALSIECPSA